MATFTAKIATGKERESVAFSAGGTTTEALTVIADAAKIPEKRALIDLLDKVKDRLIESDGPPA